MIKDPIRPGRRSVLRRNRNANWVRRKTSVPSGGYDLEVSPPSEPVAASGSPLVISTETAGKRSPTGWPDPPPGDVDFAAGVVARALAKETGTSVVSGEIHPGWMRLGKPADHRHLFPHPGRLDDAGRTVLVNDFLRPHQAAIEAAAREAVRRFGYVVHLSVRTFPARVGGETTVKRGGAASRWVRGDVGLLYDPADGEQSDLAAELLDEWWETAPMLKVRRNHPRSGRTTSIVTVMTRRLDDLPYVGLQLWCNRRWTTRDNLRRREALSAMSTGIRRTLG